MHQPSAVSLVAFGATYLFSSATSPESPSLVIALSSLVGVLAYCLVWALKYVLGTTIPSMQAEERARTEKHQAQTALIVDAFQTALRDLRRKRRRKAPSLSTQHSALSTSAENQSQASDNPVVESTRERGGPAADPGQPEPGA